MILTGLEPNTTLYDTYRTSSPEDKGQNRALFDKSMKLCTLKLDPIRVILKIGGNLYIAYVSYGGHFSKWPPKFSPISKKCCKLLIFQYIWSCST